MNLQEKSIDELLQLEYIETNGLGGYASSSITGANTRKYHGLLVAPFNPPTNRRILIAKIEERIIQGETISEIAVNQYPNTIYPEGFRHLKSFTRRPLATWLYEGENWKLKKTLFMLPNSNTTVVTYKNVGKTAFNLETHPLLENKDYHSTFGENNFDFYYEKEVNYIKTHAFHNSPAVYIKWNQGDFQEYRSWYKNIQLPKEQYRGQESSEDYYRIGFISSTLEPDETFDLVLTTESEILKKTVAVLEKETLKSIKALKNTKIKDDFYNDLLVSGNQFIVNRASTNSKSIIAGYHWFTDWGRDTMIAMRGLTIATGDQKTSKSILSTFFKYINQGMLPNRFPDYDGQEVEYNTIDATLWLFISLYEYYETFNDKDFIAENISALKDIIEHHIKGTFYNIHVNDLGFIEGGQDGWQLTWMDAKVNNYVVTPRIGAPVEINALWYNALCIYEYFCKKLKQKTEKEFLELKKQVKTNFKKEFLTPNGYLYDVITTNGKDNAFRPNQICVVSLPFSLLTPEEESNVVRLVTTELYTDLGLKTLNSKHPSFSPHYGGDQWHRDTAYHQGTVWPFLLMEYWEAYLKVNAYTKSAKKEVKEAFIPLKNHFYESNCIHGISEIFDGGNPNPGRGCIQQAWSVAAVLKLYTDHKLYNIK